MHGEKCHAGLCPGVAILGILLLNISAFGLPKAAYLNPAWSGSASLSDAWTWALLDLLAQVKFLTLFALLFGAGLQLLLPRGKRWIQSRLTLLALLVSFNGLFFWDGDILLAYALVGLVSWRMVREAHHIKSLFNTGGCSTSPALRCWSCGDDLRDRGESLVGAGRGELQ
ncbi:hypothetical protein LAD59_12465 [Klebsiella pneumoniae]|nr:hypothetical protein [Klebsiella pneumoniae]